MAKHRFLRIETRLKGTVTYSEVGTYEPDPFTGDDAVALDLGRSIVREDAYITDLIAYYEVRERQERVRRALEVVS